MSTPEWTHIFMHHSACPDTTKADAIAFRDWHLLRGWSDIGYHYVVEKIDKSYLAIGGRPLDRMGAHCPGWNDKAIGVCLAGNFQLAAPPSDQLEVAAKLVASLCHIFNVPVEHIDIHKSHRQTECPGEHFNLDEFRTLVRRSL